MSCQRLVVSQNSGMALGTCQQRDVFRRVTYVSSLASYYLQIECWILHLETLLSIHWYSPRIHSYILNFHSAKAGQKGTSSFSITAFLPQCLVVFRLPQFHLCWIIKETARAPLLLPNSVGNTCDFSIRYWEEDFISVLISEWRSIAQEESTGNLLLLLDMPNCTYDLNKRSLMKP